MTSNRPIDVLRDSVKAKGLTYREIASATGKSESWIGVVMRGNYPHRGAGLLPKGVADFLASRGFKVPEEIGTYGGGQDSAALRTQHRGWVEVNAAALADLPHPWPSRAKAGETMLDSLRWVMEHAGRSKREIALSEVAKTIGVSCPVAAMEVPGGQ